MRGILRQVHETVGECRLRMCRVGMDPRPKRGRCLAYPGIRIMTAVVNGWLLVAKGN